MSENARGLENDAIVLVRDQNPSRRPGQNPRPSLRLYGLNPTPVDFVSSYPRGDRPYLAALSHRRPLRNQRAISALERKGCLDRPLITSLIINLEGPRDADEI
jgi:hypothetical protein